MTSRAHAHSGMTFDEAAKLDPDTHRGELDQGRWVPVTKSTWRHGRIMVKLSVLLELWAREHPGWVVACGDPGTKLSRSPDTLRGPDVGVISAARMPTGKGADGWLEGAPDVAIEIAGDSQSTSELTRKALEYLSAGAKIAVVIDPDPERALIFTPPDHVRLLSKEDAFDLSSALPGFTSPLAELF